tara:strand:+ start:18718 stop:19812 length:1095 start_codon:yes stop_codon:yes gene_type:complete
MATPSGAISFEDIRTEFGTPQANNSLNNYYSGGSALGAPLANVAASGAITMSSLRSIEKTQNSGANINAASGVPNGSSLIFFTNGICYSNTTGTAALYVPSSRTGATTVVINHSVVGKAGNGGNGQAVTYSDNNPAAPTGTAGDGTGGGAAFHMASPTHMDNNSGLYAGSGGGGGGSAYGTALTNINSGITCTSTTFKGITTNTTANTLWTVGTGGGGGSAGDSTIANSSDGSVGSAGGGGHTTNFANGNQSTTITGTQCTSNGSYYNARHVKMVSNQGNFSNTPGAGGGSNGNAGSGRTGTTGSVSFPSLSNNGTTASSIGCNGNGDPSSGGGAGYAIQGWNSYSITVHGIASSQGSFTGNVN